MAESEALVHHSLIMEDRKRLSFSGVKDILGFDEEAVSIITVMGKAVIRGENLRIESFTNESGDLIVEGKLHALVYLNESSQKGTILGRLFK